MDFEIVGLLEIGSRSFYIQLYVESRKFPRFGNAHDLQNNTCTVRVSYGLREDGEEVCEPDNHIVPA